MTSKCWSIMMFLLCLNYGIVLTRQSTVVIVGSKGPRLQRSKTSTISEATRSEPWMGCREPVAEREREIEGI